MSWWSGQRSRGEAQANTAALLTIIEGYRAETRRLTDLLVEMKRDGFHPAGPTERLEPVDLTVPDAIELAIRQRAAKGSELEGELRRWSMEMLRGNSTEEDVANMILKGGDDDE